MNILEAARRVTKTPNNRDNIGNFFEAVERLFDFDPQYCGWYRNESKEVTDRLAGYWIKVFMDSDSYVGTMAYFLDDELIMIAQQTGCKSDAHFDFIDQAAFNKFSDFINQFRDKPEPDFLDTTQEIEPYEFQYSDTCINTHALRDGERVNIRRISMFDVQSEGIPPMSYCDDRIWLQHENTREIISVKELTFHLNIDGVER